MVAGPQTRRIAVIALVLAGSGVCSMSVAAAEPLPPLPDPGTTVTSVEQTVTTTIPQTVQQTVQQVTSSPSPLAPLTSTAPTPPATATKSRTATKAMGATQPKTSGTQTAAPTTTSQPAAASPPALPSWQLPVVARLAAFQAEPPNLAQGAPAGSVLPAGQTRGATVDDIANHSGSPLRALLVTLAALAAAALAAEQVRQWAHLTGARR
jgi:hypothetical protein